MSNFKNGDHIEVVMEWDNKYLYKYFGTIDNTYGENITFTPYKQINYAGEESNDRSYFWFFNNYSSFNLSEVWSVRRINL